MDRLSAIFGFLYQGASVADPALWKNRQITVTILSGVIVAALSVLRSFGVDVPLTDADISSIAVTILVVVNTVLTLTTSKKIGIPPKETP